MNFEVLAKSTIENMLSKVDGVDTFISSGDKEPSWDGNIYLNKTGSSNKEGLIKIPVQLKSKRVKHLMHELTPQISYRVQKADLENYMNNGGALYIIVYIDESTGESIRVYYLSITPFKAKKILRNGKSKQKSFNLLFKTFPSNPSEIIQVLSYYHQECQNQASFVNIDTPKLADLNSLEQINELVMTTDALWNGNIFEMPSAFSNHEAMLYAKTNGAVKIPIECIEDIQDFHITSPKYNITLSVNGITFYHYCALTVNKDTVTLVFGNCFTIITTNKANLNNNVFETSFSFNLRGTLSERITGLKCFIELASNRGFYIGTDYCPITKLDLSLDKYQYELNELEKLQTVFSQMDVCKNLDMDNCDEGDLWRIKALIASNIEGKPIYGLKNDLPPVFKYHISNITLLVACSKEADRGYRFTNFFDSSIKLKVQDANNDKFYNVSKYAKLKAEDLTKIDNLSLKKIITDIKSVKPNKFHIEYSNILCLELITAFDISNLDEFLDTGLDILEYLSALMHSEYDTNILKINQYQIYARKRPLTHKEKQSLYKMMDSDNISIQTCCLILLDEPDEAKLLLDKMDLKTRQWFVGFPIYRLYQNKLIPKEIRK